MERQIFICIFCICILVLLHPMDNTLVDFELRLKCLIRRAQPLLLLRVEIDHILVNY